MQSRVFVLVAANSIVADDSVSAGRFSYEPNVDKLHCRKIGVAYRRQEYRIVHFLYLAERGLVFADLIIAEQRYTVVCTCRSVVEIFLSAKVSTVVFQEIRILLLYGFKNLFRFVRIMLRYLFEDKLFASL